MISENEKLIEQLKDKFETSMVWKSKAVELFEFDEVKTLVLGNINGFCAHVLESLNAKDALILTERTARMEVEKMVESLRKENEFMHEAIYKEAVAEGIHDRLNDAQKERDEAINELQRLKESTGLLP